MTWEVGDLFRFIGDNPNGGSVFGTTGDIGRINRVVLQQRNLRLNNQDGRPDIIDKLFFDFVSVNEDISNSLRSRSGYLRRAERGEQPTIFVASYNVEPLIKAYALDQQLDEQEDLL